jgi:RhtB (resistance to homoserine/threonine) family protein
MDSTFVTVAVIGALAVVSPGPDFIIVTRNSLLYSKRVGLATALGIAAGTIWWIVASILGISLLIAKTVVLFNIIKWMGATYLIYLGVSSFRAKKARVPDLEEGRESNLNAPTVGAAFRVGFLTNLLNPKCALFFVSLFSVVIAPATPAVIQGIYGLEITIIAAVWFSLLATVLSADKVKRVFERFSIMLERVTGAILIVLGIKVALYQQK